MVTPILSRSPCWPTVTLVTLTDADPSNPNPVVSRGILDTQLPSSGGVPMFAWGTGAEGGGTFYWLEAHAEVNRAPTSTLLNSIDYVSPNLQDPAVWSVFAQGNVTQVPVGTPHAGGVPPRRTAQTPR
jgi:hypothetical protein